MLKGFCNYGNVGDGDGDDNGDDNGDYDDNDVDDDKGDDDDLLIFPRANVLTRKPT